MHRLEFVWCTGFLWNHLIRDVKISTINYLILLKQLLFTLLLTPAPPALLPYKHNHSFKAQSVALDQFCRLVCALISVRSNLTEPVIVRTNNLTRSKRCVRGMVHVFKDFDRGLTCADGRLVVHLLWILCVCLEV